MVDTAPNVGTLLEHGVLNPPCPDDDVSVYYEVHACPSGIARLSVLVVPVRTGGPTSLSRDGWRHCHRLLDELLGRWTKKVEAQAAARVARGGCT